MSYDIKFNEVKNEVIVTTPVCLIDNAHVLRLFQHPDWPDTKPKHSVRAIFHASKSLAFRTELAQECEKLLNGQTQFHPLLASDNTPEKYICNDFIKIGTEVIAQKKEIDKLQKDPTAKKAYSSVYDYLAPLAYFYTRSEFDIPVFDMYGKELKFDSDDFFAPSFKGSLRIGIKWCSSDKRNPLNGGTIYSFLKGIQFLGKTEMNFMREEVKFEASAQDADCMFELPEKEKSGIPWDDKKAPSQKKRSNKTNDDIDDYTERF